MNAFQILLDQMALDVTNEIARLDEAHLQKFLEWLQAHSYKVKTLNQLQKDFGFDGEDKAEYQLKNSLREWFASSPIAGLLWEYRLLLNEIAWWHEHDSPSLAHVIPSEEGNTCSNS